MSKTDRCMGVLDDGTPCPHGQKIIPKLCIPPVGHRADVHTPMTAFIGLKICEECFKRQVARGCGEILGDDIRGIFVMLAGGFAVPDFDSAYLERVLISSKEYQDHGRKTGEW